MIHQKLRSLAGITSILVCLMLTTFACGSEQLTTSTPININPSQSVPTVKVSTTGAITPTNSPQITPTNSINGFVPTTRNLVATSSTSVNSLQTNWLKAIPCRAPCWENVTPGVTTPNEAIEILKNNPEFIASQYGGNQLKETIGDRGQAAVIWGFLSFHAEPTPPRIEIIKPTTQPYKLKDIFSLYGEPSHVIAVKAFQEGTQPQKYNIYLIYMSQGLILANTFSEIPTFTPDTSYTEVYFFIPGLQGFSLVNGQADIIEDVMVEWQGFKDFKFYCRTGDVSTGIRKCN